MHAISKKNYLKTLNNKCLKLLVLSGVLLLSIRAILPPLITLVINLKLESELPQYRAKIDDVDLNFFKGLIRIKDISVVGPVNKNEYNKINFKQRSLNINLSYEEILKKKKLFLDISAINPKLGIDLESIDKIEKIEKKTQIENKSEAEVIRNEVKETLSDQLKKYSFLVIKSFKVKDGNLTFKRIDIKGKNKISLKDIFVTLGPINFSDSLKTHFNLKAYIIEGGEVNISGNTKFNKNKLITKNKFSLTNLDLKNINDIALAYIPLDFTKGKLSFIGENNYHEKLTGYIKFFFHDIDVISNDQNFRNSKHIFAEVISGVTNWILENSTSENLAFKVPYIFIPKEGLKVDKSEIFWSSLENKFEKMEMTYDGTFSSENMSE